MHIPSSREHLLCWYSARDRCEAGRPGDAEITATWALRGAGLCPEGVRGTRQAGEQTNRKGRTEWRGSLSRTEIAREENANLPRSNVNLTQEVYFTDFRLPRF